jgi:hypothetical protein
MKKKSKQNKAPVILRAKKVPFCKLYIVRDLEIEKLKKSRAIQAGILTKLFGQIADLKRKLKRYEG